MNPWRKLEDFPLGRAPAVMLFLLLLSIPFLPHPQKHPGVKDQIEFWVFASTHYDEYLARIPLFEKTYPGVKIRLQQLPSNVLADKLMAAFLSETAAPDLVEIEISQAGRFFLGRISDIGFEDLTERLKKEGWLQRVVRQRFVPWSSRGHIFGVPHDLHPVVLLYREDLLRPLGINLPQQVQTWDDFLHLFSRKELLDINGDGHQDRFAIMFNQTDSGHVRLLLYQRGGNLFDSQGRVLMDSPLAVDTVEFARKLFKKRLAFPTPPFGPDLYGPMKEDRVYCVMAPDWFVGMIRKFAPELSGKWRAMPLPSWQKGGRRTSSWGGTMIGMTKQSKNKKLVWELLKFLYFDKGALVNRYEKTRIIPPLKEAWKDPVFAQPDPYLGGQPLGLLFVQLGKEVPPVIQDQYAPEAIQEMDRACYKILTNPKADTQQILTEAGNRIRQRIQRDRFRQG